MPLTIPDEILKQSGLSEREMAIEIACRLFAAGTLTLPQAIKLSGLQRLVFESELRTRGIAAYRPTVQDLRDDIETLDRLGL